MIEHEKLDSPEKVKDWLVSLRAYAAPSIQRYFDEYGPDAWWKLREKERFKHEKRLRPAWIDHQPTLRLSQYYIYVEPADQMKIAFTPDEKYGAADRQVTTTVGRFLTKYFSDKLTEVQIKNIGDEHRSEFGPPVVHFLFDQKSIVEAYLAGPNSCMSKKELAAKFEHPVGIYDGPDTALAIIKNGERITARTVVRTDTKPMKFSRIYGDEPVLKKRLEALGFRNEGIIGARLRLAEHGNRAIVPYIDGASRITVDRAAGLIQVTTSGIDAQSQAGLSEPIPLPPDHKCDHCGRDMIKREGYRAKIAGKKSPVICSRCASEIFVPARNASDTIYALRTECIELEGWYYLNDPEVLKARGYVLCAHDSQWRAAREVIFVPDRNSHYVKRSVCVPIGQTNAHMRSDCYIDTNGFWALKRDRIAA